MNKNKANEKRIKQQPQNENSQSPERWFLILIETELNASIKLVSFYSTIKLNSHSCFSHTYGALYIVRHEPSNTLIYRRFSWSSVIEHLTAKSERLDFKSSLGVLKIYFHPKFVKDDNCIVLNCTALSRFDNLSTEIQLCVISVKKLLKNLLQFV